MGMYGENHFHNSPDRDAVAESLLSRLYVIHWKQLKSPTSLRARNLRPVDC